MVYEYLDKWRWKQEQWEGEQLISGRDVVKKRKQKEQVAKKREQKEQVAKKREQMVQKHNNQLEYEKVSLCSGEHRQGQTNHKGQHRRKPNDQQYCREHHEKDRHRGEHQVERKTEQTSGGYHRPREDHRSEGHCSPTEPSFVSYKRGEGEERGEGDWESKGRGQAADELRLGFLNCRGWHSREVDVKMMLRKLDLDVMGLAETFLQRD